MAKTRFLGFSRNFAWKIFENDEENDLPSFTGVLPKSTLHQWQGAWAQRAAEIPNISAAPSYRKSKIFHLGNMPLRLDP